MSERWIIVGAGSAGCVLANRLSADANRQVILLDDGPDLAPDSVPAGIAGPDFFAAMEEAGRIHPELFATRAPGIEPTVYQRGRGIGGSSAVNAMVALRGDDALYSQWGWHDHPTAWDRVQIPAEVAAVHERGPVDEALIAADARAEAMKLTRRNGRRVTSAEAYLWPVLDRSNLEVRPESPVSRILFDDHKATGVLLTDGTEINADNVVVAAGAIHSPVVLLRSGVDTPGVGVGLQDHPSAVFTLQLKPDVDQNTAGLPIASALHATVDDHHLQLLAMSHLGAPPERAGLGALMAALMNPRGRAGTVTVDPSGSPVIDFALLHDGNDLAGLVHAVKLAQHVLQQPSFEQIVDQIYIDDVGTTAAALDDDTTIAAWLRTSCGDYVHATSTCAMGTVVDQDFKVEGYEHLFVCDASVFPSIPHVNTHLPTTMLAERFGLRHA